MYSVAALQRYVKGAQMISSHCRNIEVLTYPNVILFKIPVYEKPLYYESENVGDLIDVLREPYEMTAVFSIIKDPKKSHIELYSTSTQFK